MKTLIAVPCFDMVHTEFMQSVIALEKPENTSFTVVKNTLIHIARNTIARNAIEAGFDRILWLDSDMNIPRDALMCMKADMDGTGADLVTGLYFTRQPPIKPVIYSKLWWEKTPEGTNAGAGVSFDYPDGLHKIAGCGFGCCLTSVRAIREVWEQEGVPFNPLEGFGEDLSFCVRLQRVGGVMMCDADVKCGHVGVMEYNEAMFRAQEVDWHEQQ